MVRFHALLGHARERLDHLLALAVVPVAVSVVAPEKFERIAASGADLRLGVSFGFPTTVATSWDFLSLPTPGGTVRVGPESVAAFAPVAAAVAALTAALGAVYLGTIDRELDGDDPDPVADISASLLPLAGFEALRTAVLLGIVALGVVAVPLLVLGLVGALVLAYLFYPTPYLVVCEGRTLVGALGRSYALAARGGDYAEFFVKYLVGVAAVSLLATPLFTTSVAAAVVGCAFLAPVCVVFNGATMAFFRGDLDEPEPGTRAGTGPDGDAGPMEVFEGDPPTEPDGARGDTDAVSRTSRWTCSARRSPRTR